MILPEFPVDDATLLAVEHALGACLSQGEDGEFVNVGSNYDLNQLLDFLSGYDETKEVPMLDDIGQSIPDIVEYVGGPIYHSNDVISALIKEIRRLREISL